MKKHLLFVPGIMICILSFLTSCEKKVDTISELDSGIAFCAGSFTNEKGYPVPCYWSGTDRTDITGDGLITGVVNAIFVKDGTVYSAGHYSTASKSGIPCYWVGKDLHILESEGYAEVSCITVSNGIVYCGGMYVEGSKEHSCYWKGGSRIKLDDQEFGTQITSIGVTNSGTVFCAGSDKTTNPGSPCYWKNTNYFHLSKKDIFVSWSGLYNYHTGEVLSLDISGEEVYFGGRGDGVYNPNGNLPQPSIWEKGDLEMYHLSDDNPGCCYSVCAANGTFYFGGNMDPDGANNNNKELTACYWQKGGNAVFLHAGKRITAIGSRQSKLYCVVEGVPGKTYPSYWDGAAWYDMVGSTDISKSQIRCYAIAR